MLGQNLYNQDLTVLLIILVTLAAARVVRFVTFDRVPFGPVRDWIESKSKDENGVEQQPWHWLHKMLECPWCSGVWTVFVAFPALIVVPVLPLSWISLPFAMMHVVGLLNTIGIHKGDDDDDE